MKSLRTLILLVVLGMLAVPVVYLYSGFRAVDADAGRDMDDDDADLPPGIRLNKEDYLKARTEQIGMLRGWDTAEVGSRQKAIAEMESSELTLKSRGLEAQAGSWTPLGPAPIPVNSSTAYSGRVSAIAVHPTDPNIVYVGTAQGGLYRTLDGGATWTPLMDSAMSLAIGAVAIAPSDPNTVFVGTGESTLCGSGCFIGVGLYRINNANSANPVLTGPLNKDASNADVFTGRAVSEVIVSPTDPNIVFAATTSGIAGIGNDTTGLTVPNAGVYRTTNAMSANPTFQKLTIQGTGGADRSVTDIAIEPGNPSRLLVGVVGNFGDGGVYMSTNALSSVPTFSRTLATGDGAAQGRTEFAINKVGGVITVYAATGMGAGTISKSSDGGATFPTSVNNGFCGSQCFYDIGVAVDPNDASRVYLGGNPNMTFGRSTDGGATFLSNGVNLHSDTQAIAVAPSNPNIVYFGSDGGIWKTSDASAATITWSTLNNSSFSASQFMGLAIHPTNRNFLIGGTQDNGTHALSPNGTTWMRTDGGDGGFTVIDKNATDTTNVVSYHTFYNSSGSLLGFVRSVNTNQNSNPQWAGFYGCGGTANGINCGDAVLFYAPLVGGPNAPGSSGNTLYYGTTRLYRSINQGITMTDVSGALPAPISAIGISPLNDDIRLVGTMAGKLYLSTTSGATSMVNVTGNVAPRYIGRIAMDPANQNVAYVALNGFGLASGQHVWKTTNLLSGSPTWVAAGNGIPDVPVNAFAVNPNNSQDLFAGTDIGVFRSTDGGANWIPFSNGLPRVAVFGLEISKAWQVVKIATHGRGIWEYNLAAAPTRRAAFDYDGDGKSDVSVFRPSNNIWYLNRSTVGFTGYQFGAAADILAPADFTGDGKTDVVVFRPSSGMWFVMRSEDNTFYGTAFGMNGDIPAPADYDGDGKADLAVFRPSSGTWYLQRSTSGFSATQFGTNGDVPTIGDFDGDGKSDIALYRPSGGTWYRLNSSNGSFFAIQFGAATDKVVPADYTGDGKTDIAVWRPSNGTWYILRSEDGSFYGSAFGGSGDLPVPGDYDGDGKADIGVFRPSQGTWYELRSASGFSALQFGMAGDKPTPNSIVY